MQPWVCLKHDASGYNDAGRCPTCANGTMSGTSECAKLSRIVQWLRYGEIICEAGAEWRRLARRPYTNREGLLDLEIRIGSAHVEMRGGAEGPP